MMRSDRRAGIGALHTGRELRSTGGASSVVPADIVGKLIVLGVVLAFSFSAPAAPLAVLQEDADRSRLRRQAQRAGLHGLFGQADRGFTQKLDVLGADHALGGRGRRGSEMR